MIWRTTARRPRRTLIVGPGVDFRRGFACEIARGGRVVIGQGTTFTFHALIRCSASIEIGEGCAFGQATLIADAADAPSELVDHVEAEPANAGSSHPLRIGAGVGVGDKATVHADLGEHAMVASQAVVTKAIPAYCVAAGSPARVVRYFGPENRPAAR